MHSLQALMDTCDKVSDAMGPVHALGERVYVCPRRARVCSLGPRGRTPTKRRSLSSLPLSRDIKASLDALEHAVNAGALLAK